MKQATTTPERPVTTTPQRTVSISLSGKRAEDAAIAYSYWSPNDGLTRSGLSECDLYQQTATTTLFVLDYASTGNGWIIVGTEPNPAGAPSLETIRGPLGLSIMTMFPYSPEDPQVFNFYLVFRNSITGETVKFDPQEKNIPIPT